MSAIFFLYGLLYGGVWHGQAEFRHAYRVLCRGVRKCAGVGRSLFASLCGAGILSKEEKERTAEFLLAHPVSRRRIITEKLAAVLVQVTAMNLIIYAVSVGAIAAVGEAVPWKEINLLHLAYYLLQLELAGICFGISAFMRKGTVGTGLGIAAVMYFLNLIANIAESAEFLKYITPFGFCEGADIVANGSLDGKLVVIGMAVGLIGVTAAYVKYGGKDIR